MRATSQSDSDPKEVLRRYRRITVVGLSPNPARPSNDVTRYMLAQGYLIDAVNPGHDKILDRPSYRSLAEVPGPLEIVNLFRSPEHLPEIIDELLPLKPGAIWLQLGVTHPEAERRVREAGIPLISNRCIKIEHMDL